MERASDNNKAKIIIIIPMLIWGSMGLIVKNVDLPSSLIAFVRGVIGVLFLLLVLAVQKKRTPAFDENPAEKTPAKTLVLLVASGIALGVNWIFLFEAYKTTTIANATLSYYLEPIMIVAVSPIVLKERLTVVKTACVGAALLGMAVISGFFAGGPGQATDLLGIQFGVLAGAAYASLTLMNKFLKNISSLSATIAQLCVASVMLLPYTLLTEDVGSIKVDAQMVAWLVVLGVVHTGLAFWLYFDSVPKLKAQTIAVVSYVDPLSAIVLATLILHEPLGYLQILGGALILGSVFVSERFGNMRIQNVFGLRPNPPKAPPLETAGEQDSPDPGKLRLPHE